MQGEEAREETKRKNIASVRNGFVCICNATTTKTKKKIGYEKVNGQKGNETEWLKTHKKWKKKKSIDNF